MTAVTPDKLPLQRLYRWERERAHEIYMSQPMGGGILRDYTWAQAIGEARRVAAYLKSLNFEPGSRIAILSKNCAWWLMMDYAIWMAGHVSVPLYPTLTAESVRQILDHSESKLVFVGKLDDFDKMQPGIPQGMPGIACALSPASGYPQWEDLVAKTAPMTDSPLRGADELATIIYTSGTTGMPKGVMHPFSSFVAATDAVSAGFKLTADDRVLSYLPLSHVAERAFVEAGSVYAGFRIYFAESLETFAQDLQRARPTLFFSVPRLWVKFQQGIFSKMPKRRLDFMFKLPIVGSAIKKKIRTALGLNHVRFAFGGAAPMPASLLSWYRELGLELLEVYGMTENFGCSHGSFPGKGRAGYVGSTWPGVECKLSEAGEVLTRGPTTMSGYFKEPAMTRDSFTADGWLRTGDLGEFDEQGRLRITGRAKELFKTSKGKYVAPAPIENKLTAHSQIEAVCVTGVNFPQPFAIVMLPLDVGKAMIEPNARGELTASFTELLNNVNSTLDDHEQLGFVAVVPEQWGVENGFLTPTLKIKRSVVEKHYEPMFDRWSASKTPVIWS